MKDRQTGRQPFLLAAAVESQNDTASLLDAIIRGANETALGVLGYTREELLGRLFRTLLIDPGDVEVDTEDMQTRAKPVAFATKDGAKAEVALSLTVACDEAGRPATYICLGPSSPFEPPRKRVALETDGILREMIDAMPYPFYVVNTADYQITLANRAARREWLGESEKCYAMTHQRDLPCCGEDAPCPLEEVMRTGRPTRVEHEHYDRDGTPHEYEVHAFPIKEHDENIEQVIVYAIDMTERHRIEERRKNMIRRLTEALVHIRTLHGLIPICAQCKRIRDEKGDWQEVENYISGHTDAEFSHSLCPECAHGLYPNLKLDRVE